MPARTSPTLHPPSPPTVVNFMTSLMAVWSKASQSHEIFYYDPEAMDSNHSQVKLGREACELMYCVCASDVGKKTRFGDGLF